MPDTLSLRHGVTMLVCAPDGPALAGDRDATDLIGATYGTDAELAVVPVARLDDRFFRLSTGVAGEIVQKFVTYRLRLVVVGDISAHTGASAALRDFVRESNRGDHLWFVADLAELDALLERAARRGHGRLPAGG